MIIYGNAVSSGRVPRAAERIAQRAALRTCPRCGRALEPGRVPRIGGAALLCGDCVAAVRSLARSGNAG